jgi:NADPH:quinone reductase-like Zn-dependent oxidoreductase
MDAAQIVAGQTVLIVGATGGVGSFAVQLAAQAGARVLATAAPSDAEYARRLGARDTIDHTSTDTDTDTAEQALRLEPNGADVAVDLINAGPGLAGTAAAVKPGGRLISTLMGPDSFDRGVMPVYIRMTAGDGQLQRLADRAAEGRLTVEIAATYPFPEAPTAMADFAAGKHTRGKVVIALAT